MRAAMERLFGGSVNDPRAGSGQIDELIEFAAAEGQIDSPAKLLNFVSDLERSSTLSSKHTTISRAWQSMQALKAQRAISALERGS